MTKRAWAGLLLLSLTLSSAAHADEWQSGVELLDAHNYTAAIEIFKHMAEVNDSRAINMLAVMYSRGAGVEMDIDKALEYAFRVDELKSNAHTQGFISMLYMMKLPADADASYAWLKKATFNESIPGLFIKLARYYEGGIGVAMSQEKAYVWYVMALMPKEIEMGKYINQKSFTQAKITEFENKLSEEEIKSATKLAESCFSKRSEACY
jgi:TPR repeat protein